MYTVELKNGFPAFYIYTPEHTDASGTTIEASYNNLEYFSYTFMVYSNDTTSAEPVANNITAELCKDVIPKYITDEYYLSEIEVEFGLKYDQFLCPKAESWNLFYPAWLSWGNEYSYELL